MDINYKDNKELALYILNRLKEQGKPSFSDGTCQYRAKDGCKCAVGHIIPDDYYLPEMEGFTLWNETVGCQLTKVYPGIDFGVLDALQTLHDNYASTSELYLKYLSFAEYIDRFINAVNQDGDVRKNLLSTRAEILNELRKYTIGTPKEDSYEIS